MSVGVLQDRDPPFTDTRLRLCRHFAFFCLPARAVRQVGCAARPRLVAGGAGALERSRQTGFLHQPGLLGFLILRSSFLCDRFLGCLPRDQRFATIDTHRRPVQKYSRLSTTKRTFGHVGNVKRKRVANLSEKTYGPPRWYYRSPIRSPLFRAIRGRNAGSYLVPPVPKGVCTCGPALLWSPLWIAPDATR
jgi:hypothetical protein